MITKGKLICWNLYAMHILGKLSKYHLITPVESQSAPSSSFPHCGKCSFSPFVHCAISIIKYNKNKIKYYRILIVHQNIIVHQNVLCIAIAVLWLKQNRCPMDLQRRKVFGSQDQAECRLIMEVVAVGTRVSWSYGAEIQTHSEGFWSSIWLLLYIQSRPQNHGLVPPTGEVNLSASII